MKKLLTIPALAGALMISGCETTGGTAALGGLISGGACAAMGGSTTECAIAAAAGAAVTYLIANELDKRDRETYAQAQAEAASTGRTVTKISPETNNTIQFVPTNEYVNDKGQTCRNLDADYTREGQLFEQQQVVCRVDGVWEEVEA